MKTSSPLRHLLIELTDEDLWDRFWERVMFMLGSSPSMYDAKTLRSRFHVYLGATDRGVFVVVDDGGIDAVSTCSYQHPEPLETVVLECVLSRAERVAEVLEDWIWDNEHLGLGAIKFSL